MTANSFGNIFRITSFGESHGTGLGVVIDGCPSGVEWQSSILESDLARRRPGNHGTAQDGLVSARTETDTPEILSGVYEGLTLGTPIAILVRNGDARSADYAKLPDRPGHADDVWRAKFGNTDPRGGGRSSGRETVARVLAGSIAKMMLAQICPGLHVFVFARIIGPVELDASLPKNILSNPELDIFPARIPDRVTADRTSELLKAAKQAGESYGGTAEIWIEGAPAGLGQPVFRKIKSELAAAFFSVGAVNGVEIGDAGAASNGTEFHADPKVYGGIRGGITTGERIVARVNFKPTSSMLDVAKKGRHDPCIVPRAIPVLEAMAYLVLADQILWKRMDRV